MATRETERGSSSSSQLPEDMIPEILARLPPKYLLRSRAVCKAWRDIAADTEFIRKHHSHQPLQPLVLTRDVGPLKAVHLASNKCRVVLRVIERVPIPLFFLHDARDALMVHGSCGGLLLISFNKSFFVCNPATRQGARLPLLLQNDLDVLGFYKHDDPGEYRVLYQQPDALQGWYSYHILTVGSPQVRSIQLRTSSADVAAGLARGLESSCASPPVLFRDSLHWSPQESQEGDILVFDRAAESFSRISPPAEAMLIEDDHTQLFEMEGKLAMFCWHQIENKSVIWFMDNYEQMNWVKLSIKLAYQPIPLPPCPIVLYQEGHMLIVLYQEEASDKLLHCYKTGKLHGFVDCSTRGIRITPHMLKESLVLHEFLQSQRNDGACEWFPELEFADGSDTAISGNDSQST
ncbi:hypothetical protein ZWY2020_007832 [Hordeum vulgare]|nr:hypothetical protein ZWY2020_007832 [Hordeum vulgare]